MVVDGGNSLEALVVSPPGALLKTTLNPRRETLYAIADSTTAGREK